MFTQLGRTPDPIQTSHQSCSWSSVLPSAPDHLTELLTGVSVPMMGTDIHYSHLLVAITLIQVLLIPNTTTLKASPQLVSLTSHSQAAVQSQ